MQILFVYGVELTLGGHFKSGQALARGLRERGHSVVTWVRSRQGNAYLADMRASGDRVLCFPLAPGRNRLTKALVSGLKLLHLGVSVLRLRIDIIHCQDTALLRHLVWIAKLLGRRLVCTQAGGEYVDALHPVCVPLVVYSEELRDAYAANDRLDQGTVHYIAERIDVTVYHRFDVTGTDRTALGIPSSGRLAFTAMRIDSTKRPWLENLMDVARMVDDRGEPWTFVVAGDGDLFAEMVEHARAANATLQNVSLVFIGPVSDGHLLARWLNVADVVIGNGRSLMEGISCETQCIILGEKGEAEILDMRNIDEVMHHNFSGRHFRMRNAGALSLADTFEKLGAVLDACETSVEDHHLISPRLLDHRVGAGKLEHVYQESPPMDLSVRACLQWERMRRKEFARR